MAVLIVGDETIPGCGQAFEIGAFSSAVAFCVVEQGCANANGKWSFAHEIGHLQGARHNDDLLCNVPYAYGHGYVFPPSNKAFQTMMGISLAVPRVKYWSNPDITYQGDDTGEAGCCDNARALDQSASTVADFVKELSGTVSSNTILSGINLLNNVTVTNNATITFAVNSQIYFAEGSSSLLIESGSLLDIKPGATVKFTGYFGINIQPGAKLIAKGTVNNSIVFTSAQSSPARKDWSVIHLFGDNNELEYCTFEYGDWAVKIHGTQGQTTGNIVKNCTFRENDQGLRIENSTVTVDNVTIEDNRHAFVIVNNATATITNSLVQNNERDGIYSYASLINVLSSRFEYNGLGDVSTIHGITAFSGSDISLGPRGFFGAPIGFNTIRYNRGAGVRVYSGASVLAGWVLYSPFFGFLYWGGNNSLHDNGTKSGTYSGKDFYNASSTAMLAQKCYWGGNCPPLSSQIFGTVFTEYCLGGSPTGLSPILVESQKQKNGLLSVTSIEPNDGDTQIKKDLIEQYRQVIASQPNSNEAVAALRQYYSFVRSDHEDKLQEKSGIGSYLNELANNHTDKQLGKTALQLQIIEARRNEDVAAAIAISEDAFTKLSGEEKAGVMFNQVFNYLQAGNLSAAEQTFANFKKEFPKNESEIEILSETLERAPEWVNDISKSSVAKGTSTQPAKKFAHESLKVEGVGLDHNYPNPFNPETVIKYKVNDASSVTLKIYNLIGQEIRALVDEVQSAGSYQIRWDGKDNLGRNVASGIYVYRLRVGEQVEQKKMTLLR